MLTTKFKILFAYIYCPLPSLNLTVLTVFGCKELRLREFRTVEAEIIERVAPLSKRIRMFLPSLREPLVKFRLSN